MRSRRSAQAFRSTGRVLRPLLYIAVLVVAATWATWPLATNFTLALPTAETHAGTVPMLNAWTLWWNAESLSHGLTDYWNAPIFFPDQGALAFSEPQPILLLLAPIVWLCDSPVPAYNLYLIASIVLNGWFSMRLLRLALCANLTQWCGGICMALHPLALQNLEAVQLLPLWGILWTMEAALNFHAKPNLRSGLWLGLAFASISWTCIHHALFFALILGLCGWTVFPFQATRKGLTGVSIALAFASCLLLPLLWPMHRIHSRYEFARAPEVVRSLSASGTSWLTTPPTWTFPSCLSPFPLPADGTFPEPLAPGILKPLLAMACVVICRKRHRVLTRFLFGITLASVLLSFGPNLQWGEFNPWNMAADWFPPLARVRSPYRFAYFSQLSIGLMAYLAGDGLLRFSRMRLRLARRRRLSPRRWLSVSGWLLTVSLLLLLTIETYPPRIRLTYPPRANPQQEWVQFIAQETPPGASILCLPVSSGISEAAYEQAAMWMMYATQHERPILNGYSGFLPPDWQELRGPLHQDPFASPTISLVRRRGARYLVIRTDRMLDKNQLPNVSSNRSDLKLVFEDASYQIYELLEQGDNNIPKVYIP